MSAWQHVLHAFNVHCWHYLREFEAKASRKGHGYYDPIKTNKVLFQVKVCCHCNRHQIKTWREWVGI